MARGMVWWLTYRLCLLFRDLRGGTLKAFSGMMLFVMREVLESSYARIGRILAQRLTYVRNALKLFEIQL